MPGSPLPSWAEILQLVLQASTLIVVVCLFRRKVNISEAARTGWDQRSRVVGELNENIANLFAVGRRLSAHGILPEEDFRREALAQYWTTKDSVERGDIYLPERVVASIGKWMDKVWQVFEAFAAFGPEDYDSPNEYRRELRKAQKAHTQRFLKDKNGDIEKQYREIKQALRRLIEGS